MNKNGTIKLNCLATRTWIVGFAMKGEGGEKRIVTKRGAMPCKTGWDAICTAIKEHAGS